MQPKLHGRAIKHMVKLRRMTLYVLSVILMAALAVFVSACMPQSADDAQEIIVTPPEYVEPDELTELRYEDVAVGTGPAVEDGDTVLIDWEGYLFDDDSLFNSSDIQGGPYQFVVGNSDVIDGWHAGVVGMQVGGTRTLEVPAYMGFGPAGMPGMVQADQDLWFEITLLEINPVDDSYGNGQYQSEYQQEWQ